MELPDQKALDEVVARVEKAGIPANQTEDGLLVYDPSQNGVISDNPASEKITRSEQTLDAKNIECFSFNIAQSKLAAGGVFPTLPQGIHL